MWNREMPTIQFGKLDRYEPLTKAELKEIEQTRQKVRKALEAKKKMKV